MRIQYELAGRQGFTIHEYPDGLALLTGAPQSLQRTLYPCSNVTCLTNVEVYNIAGMFGREGHAPLQKKFRLDAVRQTRYDKGFTNRDGVWFPTKEFELSKN